MRVGGYKLRGYDATYEKCYFDVRTNLTDKSCVLEVFDENSGITFILELDKEHKISRQFYPKKQRSKQKKYT